MQFLSTLLLLAGVTYSMILLALGLIGAIPNDSVWDAVFLISLPMAAAGAVGAVLTGLLRTALASALTSAGSAQ